MKRTAKNILAVTAVVCIVIGVLAGVPSFINSRYVFASLFSLLVLAGLILLAIVFGG